MTTLTEAKGGSTRPGRCYLYAIGESSMAAPTELAGIDACPVTRLEMAGLSVFVSGDAPARIRPERRHLAAHQHVLRQLMNTATILPVGFGMIVPSPARLAAMIEGEAMVLASELQRVRGCVEMSLRVSWDVPNIFAHLVERDPALRAARDQMLASGSHQSKVALGELFERTIDAQRSEHAERVIQQLTPCAAEITSDRPKSEHEIVRLAALVDRARLAEFEKIINDLAGTCDATYRFDYGGPWAPHSFVRLRIDPAPGAEVA